jgi:hypothetical protein
MRPYAVCVCVCRYETGLQKCVHGEGCRYSVYHSVYYSVYYSVYDSLYDSVYYSAFLLLD